MISRTVAVGVAVLLAVSGCSDDAPNEQAADTGKPSATTIELTLAGEQVELADAPSKKCYDHEGHLAVEAYDPADPDAARLLMDYYQENASLSIHVGGESVNNYDQDAAEQDIKVTRDGASVSVTGTIGEASQPFEIAADCAEFFDTPPDSSKVDPSDTPSIPSSCPAGQAVCIPEN